MAARPTLVALLAALVGVVLATELLARPQISHFPYTPSPYEDACRSPRDSDCAENRTVVEAALRSPDTLWAFLTAPDAGFPDRRAAAVEGAEIVPIDWLVRIDLAEREISEAGFSLRWMADSASPLQSATVYRRPTDPATRTLLGRAYEMPLVWNNGIRGWHEMTSKPWPLQVGAALGALKWAMLRKEGPERILAFACETPDGARLMKELFIRSFSYRKWNMSPEGFGALRNLIRTRRHYSNFSSDLSVFAAIDPAMTEVLALELAAIADTSVFGASPVSPSLALAGARLVSDERLPISRRASVAYYIRRKTDAQGAPPHPQDDAQAQIRTLDDFKSWFDLQRPLLEAAAAKDEPRLAAARAAMDTEVCRAPSQ